MDGDDVRVLELGERLRFATRVGTYLEGHQTAGEFTLPRQEHAAERAPPAMALIVSDAPYKAYALIARAFYPESAVIPRRASSALIDPEALVPDDCDIGSNAIIERGVQALQSRLHALWLVRAYADP